MLFGNVSEVCLCSWSKYLSNNICASQKNEQLITTSLILIEIETFFMPAREEMKFDFTVVIHTSIFSTVLGQEIALIPFFIFSSSFVYPNSFLPSRTLIKNRWRVSFCNPVLENFPNIIKPKCSYSWLERKNDTRYCSIIPAAERWLKYNAGSRGI